MARRVRKDWDWALGPYHRPRDPDCFGCHNPSWQKVHYPAKCVCGGLIHSEAGDEGLDSDYDLIRRCTGCDRFAMKEA